MRVYFASWLYDITLGRSLTLKGGTNRLLSFYFLNEMGVTKEQLEKYCRTGRLDIRKKRNTK
jgi:hypothetical protein